MDHDYINIAEIKIIGNFLLKLDSRSKKKFTPPQNANLC